MEKWHWWHSTAQWQGELDRNTNSTHLLSSKNNTSVELDKIRVVQDCETDLPGRLGNMYPQQINKMNVQSILKKMNLTIMWQSSMEISESSNIHHSQVHHTITRQHKTTAAPHNHCYSRESDFPFCFINALCQNMLPIFSCFTFSTWNPTHLRHNTVSFYKKWIVTEVPQKSSPPAPFSF